MARFYHPGPLEPGLVTALSPAAARHVQVLRMQPGHALTLFNGQGGAWAATVTRMGRSEVEVQVGIHAATECEAVRAVHLAVGMPANERMDWLVEKATELGVASIQPLMTAHSVLRLKGERAEKKQAHWQSVAVAACEQCGRNRVPTIHPVQDLAEWLRASPCAGAKRAVLSLADRPLALADWLGQTASGTAVAEVAGAASPAAEGPVWFLSGPEGGLSADEDTAARALGWQAVTLGPRVLRSETAALAALTLASLGQA